MKNFVPFLSAAVLALLAFTDPASAQLPDINQYPSAVNSELSQRANSVRMIGALNVFVNLFIVMVFPLVIFLLGPISLILLC